MGGPTAMMAVCRHRCRTTHYVYFAFTSGCYAHHHAAAGGRPTWRYFLWSVPPAGRVVVIRWTPHTHPIMAMLMSTRLCFLCRRRRHASCCCCLVPQCSVCGLGKEPPDAWHSVLPADSTDVLAGVWLSYCTPSCGWAATVRHSFKLRYYVTTAAGKVVVNWIQLCYN